MIELFIGLGVKLLVTFAVKKPYISNHIGSRKKNIGNSATLQATLLGNERFVFI